MAPVMCLRSKPSKAMSCVSHTMYSSAVRCPWVEMRQLPRFSSPSNTAKTVLVLFELMTRSISLARLLRGSFYNFSVRNRLAARAGKLQHQRSGGIEPHEFAFALIAVALDRQSFAERVGAGEPGLAQRGEARRVPLPIPVIEAPNQNLDFSFDHTSATE